MEKNLNKLFAKTAIATIVAASVLTLTACDHKYQLGQNSQAQASNVLTKNSSFEQKAAYAIGASLGEYVSQMKKNQEQLIGEIPSDVVIAGFTDGVHSVSSLKREEIENILKDLDKKIQEKIEVETKKASEDNLKSGKAFLEANGKKEGVVTTKSGLQYKIIKQGEGPKAVKGDIISVTYKGSTIDGNVFDEQTKPVDFPLDNMIPGWIEGLQLMNVGSEYELYIPSALGYGENAVGQFIKPNSVLVFNVKLVDIKKADEKKDNK